MLGLLSIIDKSLAAKVAKGLGLDVPNDIDKPINHGVGANPDPKQESKIIKSATEKSDALSMLKNPTGIKSIATRQVAFLCADGVDELSVKKLKNALMNEGAVVHIIAPHLGTIKTADGNSITVNKSFLITSSVLYDAVFVPSGNSVSALKADSDVIDFINEAYKHCKVIGADQEGIELLAATNFSSKFSNNPEEMGVVVSTKDNSINFAESFISAMKEHRFWNREPEL
jgi:catalase